VIVWPVHRGSTSTLHPRCWKWERLTDLAELVTGHTPARNKPEYWNGGVSWINLNEIRELDGLVCEETRLQISELGVANSSAVVHPVGTICMSRTASVGFVTQMGERMATSQDFVNWICGSAVDPSFLMKALIASRPHLTATATGSTHKTLYVRDAERLHVLLPPMKEQRRIAAVLDAAEALRVKRRQALSKLEDLIQAVFIDIFGDPVSIRRWPIVSLASVCHGKGEYGANVPAAKFDGERPRYLRITDIRDDGSLIEAAVAPGGSERDWRSKHLQIGDVVFARSGSVGKSFLVRHEHEPLVFAGYLIRFSPDQTRVHPEYLYRYAQTQSFWAWVAGVATTVAQPNINARKYAALSLPLPPLDVQQRFVDVVDQIRQSRVALESHAEHLDDLFASLQQRAFRGEL